MGTRGYAAFRQDGDDGVLAFSVNLDAHPDSLGEAVAETARRRVAHPDEPLFSSMAEGLRGYLTGEGLDPDSVDHSWFGTRGHRNFLHDCVYCEYAYIVNLDDGVFEAWGGDEAFHSTATPAAADFPAIASRHPRRPLLGVFPLDVPTDWVARTGWPESYREG